MDRHIPRFLKNIISNNVNETSVFSRKKIIFSLSILFFLILLIFINNFMISSNKEKNESLEELVSSSEIKNVKEYFFNTLRSPYKEYKYIIKNNDSVEKILKKFKVSNDEIKIIVNDLKSKKLTNIYMGRQFSLVLKELEKGKLGLIRLQFPISNTLFVEVRKNKESFDVKKNIIKLNKKEIVIKNSIESNLYSSAVKSGIEPNVIVEFARIFGFEVDFQRDIRKNDWFEICYERFVDDNNVVKDTGKIIYASMFVNNKEINLYNFKFGNESGFYDLNGKSIVKALMKTPINGARLSSGFGNRKHPILGFTKHHNGTDFAAPTGTPIMASGSGTVITAGWCGNGGNCVRIRHNSSYTTGYGHLSKFATKVGRKVRQGQIIGYVGNTGMSTGPHLHYTVKYNGKFINSQKLKLPSGKILKGEERKEFEIERIKIDLKLSELREN